MSRYKIFLKRSKAFELAWKLFWMATGTKRVGLIVDEDGTINIVGNDIIEWDERMTE